MSPSSNWLSTCCLLETETAHYVTAELRRLGVTVRAGIGATRIEHNQARDTVVLTDGTRLPADVVVASLGVRPDTEVFETAGISCERGAIVVDEHGRTSIPDVWAVGDAVVSIDAVTGARRPVALAGPANRAGRQVADDIIRPTGARAIPAAVGTAIVRVGELTAAITGANRKSLDDAGIDYQTLHLHPNQHAGYFPEQCRCTWWCTWPHPMDDYSALKPWAVMASTNVSTCLPPRFEPDYVFPI